MANPVGETIKVMIKSIAKDGEHEALERLIRDAARYSKEGNETAFQKALREASKYTVKGNIDDAFEKMIRDGLEEGLEEGAKSGAKKSAYRRFMDSAKNEKGDVRATWNFVKGNKKTIGVLSVIGVGAVTGDGALKTAANVAKWAAVSKDQREKGAVEAFASDALDTVGGDGFSDKLKATANKVLDKTGEVVDSGRQSFSDGFEAVRERVVQAYESGKDFVTPSGDSQAPRALPADIDWSNLTEDQKYYIAMMQQQQPTTGGGIMNTLSNLSPMKSFQSLLGELFGGGKTTSLAAAIPAAMLMFGNYGWMAKIASVMLGGFAYKNAKMAQQQENISRQQSNGMFQSAGQQSLRTPAEQYAMLAAAQDDIVYRGRGF